MSPPEVLEIITEGAKHFRRDKLKVSRTGLGYSTTIMLLNIMLELGYIW